MDTTLEEVFLKVSEEDLSLENSDAGEREEGKMLQMLYINVEPVCGREVRGV